MAALLAPAAALAKEGKPGQNAEISGFAQYGRLSADFAVVRPGGPIPLLLLHGNGHSLGSLEPTAVGLHHEGFTVINLEWQDPPAGAVWVYDTAQIEEAVAWVRAHATALGVDPRKLEMLGGSRGANLALLSAENLNRAAPGTVKALAALSPDVDPQRQIERAEAGELVPGIAETLSEAYGCQPTLIACNASYVAEWSPLEKAAASAPAMLLAASQSERRTSSLEDVYGMGERLAALKVPELVVAARSGHAFAYWGPVRDEVSAFLLAQG